MGVLGPGVLSSSLFCQPLQLWLLLWRIVQQTSHLMFLYIIWKHYDTCDCGMIGCAAGVCAVMLLYLVLPVVTVRVTQDRVVCYFLGIAWQQEQGCPALGKL